MPLTLLPATANIDIKDSVALVSDTEADWAVGAGRLVVADDGLTAVFYPPTAAGVYTVTAANVLDEEDLDISEITCGIYRSPVPPGAYGAALGLRPEDFPINPYV